MYILNPPFLRQTPPRRTQFAVLLVLLCSALPLAASLPLVVMALFGGLWLLRLALLRLNISKIPLAAMLLLMVMAAVLVWQQLGTLFGREGGIAFLLLMVMLKAFEGNTRRDWQVLLLAMLFLAGAGVLLNAKPAGGHLARAHARGGGRLHGDAGRAAARAGGAARRLGFVAHAAFDGAAVCERATLSEPLWRIPQQSGAEAQTGLSDTMQPGSISNLVQSNEWVANITFSDGYMPQPGDLYWRAIIMGAFDGTRWQAFDGTYIDSAEVPAAPRSVHYQMIVRDQQGVLPALDYPTDVPPGLTGRLGRVVRAERSREGLRRIELAAALSDTLPHRLNEGERAYYTRLPEGNLRTRLLAERLWQQSAHERQFIDNVLHYYRRESFAYTLQPPKMPVVTASMNLCFKRGAALRTLCAKLRGDNARRRPARAGDHRLSRRRIPSGRRLLAAAQQRCTCMGRSVAGR